MSETLLAGVDLGTTQVKAAVFDLEGRRVAHARRGYAAQHPVAGQVERDPRQWWTTLEEVFAEIASQVSVSGVAAIAICSQVGTHVFVDADGHALLPAISWQDQRCAEVAAELNAIAAGTLGAGLQVDATSLLARAEWLRRSDPAAWEATRWILSPKDYVNMQLTGAAASDGLSSIGLVDGDAERYLALDDVVDGVLDVLPPLRDVIDVIGTTDGVALGLPAGVPVAVATMDAWGSLYGSGVTRDGEGFAISGTSEIIGLVGRDGLGAPGVVGFPPYRGLRLFAGPTQAGGDALRWFADGHEQTIPWALREAERSAPGSGGLVFLPHLGGERAPLWDPHIRGAFVGLGLDHQCQEMARAVLEGVAFSARHLLDALREAAGVRPRRLALSGGGSISDLWCQIKADVLGLPLVRLDVLDSGVLGAALLAGVAAGELADLADAARSMVRSERVFEPDPRNQAVYEQGYALYRGVQAGLRPVFSKRETSQVAA